MLIYWQRAFILKDRILAGCVAPLSPPTVIAVAEQTGRVAVALMNTCILSDHFLTQYAKKPKSMSVEVRLPGTDSSQKTEVPVYKCSGLPKSIRMACCCEVSCLSSSLYGASLVGGREGTVCLSRYCSERNFQISPRCCLGTPVRQ